MKTMLGIVCVSILSFFAFKLLLGQSYFPMHDDTQVARVVVMGRALRQGQFPVRWVSDLGYGYGYPIFNFYGPLPYYVGGSLYALGVDSVTSTKVMFGLGIILASIFCFLFLQPVYGTLGGLIGGVLFTYAPYHAVQIYIRGAVGEYWALAFIPLVATGMLLVYQNKKYAKGILIGSLGFLGVITSHTILGFLTVAISLLGITLYGVISMITKKSKYKAVLALLTVVIFGLGLSAFFWLPAFVEMKATGVSAMITKAPSGFFDHFVCLGQLWNSPWGYGGSAVGCTDDGMSLKLGKFHVGMVILGIIAWMISQKKNKKIKTHPVMGIGLLLLCFSVLGMLDISKPFWNLIPYASFIQYPWRLLSLSIFAAAICGGFFISLFRKPVIRLFMAFAVISACILINGKLFKPQYLYIRDPKAFETVDELRFRVSKVSDEYLPSDVVRPKSLSDVTYAPFKAATPLGINMLHQTDTLMRAEIDSPVNQSIVIQQAFFPGWRYWVNKKQVNPTVILGLPSVTVPEGKSIIELRFTNTPIRLLANMISLLSVILMGGVILYDKKTNA